MASEKSAPEQDTDTPEPAPRKRAARKSTAAKTVAGEKPAPKPRKRAVSRKSSSQQEKESSAVEAPSTTDPASSEVVASTPRKRAVRRKKTTEESASADPQSAVAPGEESGVGAPAPRARRPRKKAVAQPVEGESGLEAAEPQVKVAAKAPAKGRKRPKKTPDVPLPVPEETPVSDLMVAQISEDEANALVEEILALAEAESVDGQANSTNSLSPTFGVLFQAPEPSTVVVPSRRRGAVASEGFGDDLSTTGDETIPESDSDVDLEEQGDSEESEGGRRRRRRGGKGRRRGSGTAEDGTVPEGEGNAQSEERDPEERPGEASDSDGDEPAASGRRRTRRRRRSGSPTEGEDPPGTVTKVREPRRDRDEAMGIKGSTRLEAKKQRRREGREAGRRRTIITEAEFLARRESVERVMVVRQQGERTQIGVLEDGVLVEHYVSKADSAQPGSMAGNVYLGRVQNVLPSMEAAFVDIGRGRNAVLYAGEVNWDAAGLEAHRSRRIENALSSGQGVLVQVTKDPIGHKGARLTSQISLPGRYLVYVPQGKMTGISRKLPDTERTRLKKILKEIVPPDAGVIVRTAAEGASESELRADVERLANIWESIQKKAASGHAPALLHGEVDLTVRVIRDVFNEDFSSMVVSGEGAWSTVNDYIGSVAPDLAGKLRRWTGDKDVFAEFRIDEQLAKAMDRKVWLPSGGSLVIDRTEAMTVIDVNTGKFVGAGGNLEETVTKNNIEAAEEIVRQLRLRDIGGIIVIDFIDMVLESNRDLVVRRLLECLGRDRTKHQVAEVTSLGLVQMTRKRVGAGLIEVFSEPCEHCNGRGIIVSSTPVDKPSTSNNGSGGNGGEGGRRRRGRGNSSVGSSASTSAGVDQPTADREESSEAPAAEERSSASGPTPAQIAAVAYAALHQETQPGEEPEDSGPRQVKTGAVKRKNERPVAEAPVATVVEAPAGDPPVKSARGRRGASRPVATPEPTTANVVLLPATSEDISRSTSAVDTRAVSPDREPESGSASEEGAPTRKPRRRRARAVAPAGPPRASRSDEADAATK
ncbi:ribonuclease E [Austwickia chelonae]|uniref:Ribonuclease E n=1 Tax=Austwickia chelonae NBRC 105200 TaxID=1184607 RepID=K6V392_9MICO|nr:Rne/Rng family ribonuclease [Austwickia chelonae]GAB76503.1 putative ribonuclease [Austwickia chelonae NBRC 105200]SEW25852.1 ribonuclease E [Austwickia chelonae]